MNAILSACISTRVPIYVSPTTVNTSLSDYRFKMAPLESGTSK